MVDGRRQDTDFVQYTVGQYEVLQEIGQGGIGEVYVARATRGEHAGTLVCLKVLSRAFQAAKDSRRQAAIDSLRREARVVSQLRHPNIAALLDSGAYNDVWFLAFQLIAGANLGEILELQPAGVGLPPEHVRRIGIEVAAALQCAHEHDVLHRDIKPQNILISTDGEVKVVDFGVAKMNARHAADFTVGVGTPRYWAPEQVREDVVGPQTDIFALGLVLYELLTTTHPFHHDDQGEHRKNVLRCTLPPRLRESGVPGDLVAIVECCLQRDPEKRFQSAQALQTALRSGAKASGFQYEMGEIATAARDAVVEVRLLMKDAEAPERGNDNKTAQPDLHVRETQHATPQALAETVRDGIPGALTRHVRDEVVHDLSLLAQHAYEQRQTQIGRRRQTTMIEGWRHPGISGVRPSEPPTAPEAPEIQPPRDRHATAMEGAGAQVPEPLDEVQPDPELRTPRRRPRKTVGGFSQLGAGTQPASDDAAAASAPAAHDENATNVIPRKRGARWPLAIAALAIAAIYAVLASSPGTRDREGQGRQPPDATSNRVATSPGKPAAQTGIRAPAVAVEALEPPRVVTAEPSGGAPPQQSPADQLPLTSAEPSPEHVDRTSAAAQTDAPSPAKSSSTSRRSKSVRADARELVEVTIGVIPFGNVIVDGKSVGPGPVVVKLAPGPHRIVARSQELRRARTVVVTPETNRIVLDLRNDEASP